MDDMRAIREIGRHAIERPPEIEDVRIAEIFRQPPVHDASARECDEGDGEIGQRIGFDEGRLHALSHFFVVPPAGKSCRDHRTHGGAADEIDGHAVFVQCAQCADMGVATCTTAGQNDADRATSDDARQPRNVRVIAFARMEDSPAAQGSANQRRRKDARHSGG